METATLPVLRKPTATVQLSHTFTHGERKLLNTLMFYAQHQGTGSIVNRRHDVSLKDVYAAIGWTKSNNIEALKKHIRTLMTTVIEWNQYGEDRSSGWEICTFITYGAIEKGRLTYTINERIADDMLKPTLFAKVQLLVQGRFTRKHSLILYEYFQDMLGRCKSTDDVSIEFMVRHLGLNPDESYGQYKYLQRDVLKPAIAEINKHSDLTVSHKAIRSGRATTGISFCVERRNSFQFSFDLPSTDASDSTEDHVSTRLEERGMTAKSAKDMVKRFGKDVCSDALANLDRSVKNGAAVINTGAWLRTAIKEGWKSPTADTPDIKHKAAVSRAKVEDDKQKQQIAYDKYRSTLAWATFDSRSSSYKAKRQEQFMNKMRAERNDTVVKQFEKKGWDGAIVRACFISEHIEELIGDMPEASLAHFAEQGSTQSAMMA